MLQNLQEEIDWVLKHALPTEFLDFLPFALINHAIKGLPGNMRKAVPSASLIS